MIAVHILQEYFLSLQFLFTKLTSSCTMLITRINRLSAGRLCWIVYFQTRLKYFLEHLIMKNDLPTDLPKVADTAL